MLRIALDLLNNIHYDQAIYAFCSCAATLLKCLRAGHIRDCSIRGDRTDEHADRWRSGAVRAPLSQGAKDAACAAFHAGRVLVPAGRAEATGGRGSCRIRRWPPDANGNEYG